MIIEQKYDHQIDEKYIKSILEPGNGIEGDIDSVIMSDVQPTKMVGVLAPLVMINSTQIEMTDVISMTLESVGILPTLSLTVKDTYGLLTSVDMTSADNLVIVEIIPPFDGIYKKIKLYFYITSALAIGNSEKINITGIYKVPELYASKLKSYGLISTYKFIEQVAKETKLGFCSNIEDTNDDRYIVMKNTNVLDAIESEVSSGGNPTNILDVWIDFYNNINLIDIYERYNAKDNDLKLWTSQMNVETEASADNIQNTPYEIEALITNDPDAQNLPTYTKTYSISNNTGNNVNMGTDRVLTTYNKDVDIIEDVLIQDGDTKNDIFTKYFYLGESVGKNNNYIKQPIIRMFFMSNIKNTTYKFVLPRPNHGLMRGHRVNVKWYEGDLVKKSIMKDHDEEVDNTLDTDAYEENMEDQDSLVLNKKISGQYLIIGTSIDYKNVGGDMRFTQSFILSTSENKSTYGKGLDYNNE